MTVTVKVSPLMARTEDKKISVPVQIPTVTFQPKLPDFSRMRNWTLLYRAPVKQTVGLNFTMRASYTDREGSIVNLLFRLNLN